MSEPYEYELDAAREAYEEEVIKEALKNISQEGVSYYLFYYGNAIHNRITETLDMSAKLHEAGYFGPSIVSSSRCSVPFCSTLANPAPISTPLTALMLTMA